MGLSIRDYDPFTNTVIQTRNDSTSNSNRSSVDDVVHKEVQPNEIDTKFESELNQIKESKLKNSIEDQLDRGTNTSTNQTKPGSGSSLPNPFPQSLGRWETFLSKHPTLQKIHDYFSSNISITASDYDNLTLSRDNRVIKLFLDGKLNKTATIAVFDRVISAYGNKSDVNEKIAGTDILSSTVKYFGKGNNQEHLRHYLDNKLLTVVKYDPTAPKLKQVEAWMLAELWGKDFEKMPSRLPRDFDIGDLRYFEGNTTESIGKTDSIVRALKEDKASLIRERDFDTFSKTVDEIRQGGIRGALEEFPDNALHEILTTKDVNRAMLLIAVAYSYAFGDDSGIEDNEYKIVIEKLKEVARFDRSIDYLLVSHCRSELVTAAKYFKDSNTWTLQGRTDIVEKALSNRFPWTDKSDFNPVLQALREIYTLDELAEIKNNFPNIK